jgi:subtilisin family serine protease
MASAYGVRMRIRSALAVVALLALVLAPGASAAGRPTETTWHGNQIKMYDAQSAGRFGAGVTVAVLDSWVDVKHPDFQGRAVAGADCTGSSCVAGQTRDSCTHGTHVAGTVASSSFGVAPRAKILAVRVLTPASDGGECTGKASSVAAGIRWAVSKGAKVINLSLGPAVPGLSSSSEIPAAVKEAAQAGVVVVFSAGNEDLPVSQSYGEDALVVAATGPNGKLASYSQYGMGVSVAAPGGEPVGDVCSQPRCVTSLYPSNQYAVAAGTSMAAPHVAGLAALLIAQQPGRSSASVRERIKSTARPVEGGGSGLVDVKAALGVRTTASPRPRPTSSTVPVVKSPAPRPSSKPRPVAAGTTPPPTAKPTATAGGSPTASPTPAAIEIDPPPLTATPPGQRTPEDVPLPLAVLAGSLVAVGALGVMRMLLTRP